MLPVERQFVLGKVEETKVNRARDRGVIKGQALWARARR